MTIKINEQRGVVLPLAAIIIALVLIPLVALVIGMGILSADQAKLQLVGNAVSLAALEAYSRGTPPDPNVALARAQEILRKNSMVSSDLSNAELKIGGPSFTLDPSNPNQVGDIRFGLFFETNPCLPSDLSCSAGCGSSPNDYPCFKLVDPATASSNGINAVQVRLKTPVLNKAAVYFSKQYSPLSSSIASHAMASAFSRCVVLALDASLSTIGETHKTHVEDSGYIVGDPAHPGIYVPDPPNFSFFGFRESALAGLNCASLSFLSVPLPTKEQIAWCNMAANRSGSPFANDPTYHFQSDYTLGTTSGSAVRGALRVDSYTRSSPAPAYDGPQPLGAFLDGFNSAFRVLQQQKSGRDKVTVKAFLGKEINSYSSGPLYDSSLNTSALTSDFSYLLKATNIDNRKPTASGPNFLDNGWVPLDQDASDSTSGFTNLVSILDKSIQQLNDNTQCPAGAQKHIVLATDGLSTCRANPYPDGDAPVNEANTSCDNDVSIYKAAEAQLLGSEGLGTPSLSSSQKSILTRLQESNIALSVLLAGSSVQPNIKNVKRNSGDACNEASGNTGPSCFLSYEEAIAKGLGASFFDDSYDCPSSVTPCTESDAFINGDNPGFHFRGPNRVFGLLAMKSGGTFCPLQPKASPSSKYSCGPATERRLCDSDRTSGGTQAFAVRDLTESQQAADCVFKSIGYSPFWNSESICRWDGSKCVLGGPYN